MTEQQERTLLRDLFAQGRSFEQFVEEAGQRGRTFLRVYNDTEWPLQVVERMRNLAGSAGGIRVFIMAEAWCPDAAQNAAPLAALSEEVGDMRLRCFVRSQNQQLEDYFSDRGVTRIPAVLFCDGDFGPLGVWQERPKAADQLVGQIKRRRQRGEETSHLTKKLHQGYRSGEFRVAAVEEMMDIIKEALPGG